MVHGTVHTVYMCTDGVCDPFTRENARLAFAYITDNCTAGEKERKRGEGPVGHVYVCVTMRDVGECTHVCVCKKEKETSVIFMRAYDASGKEPSNFLDMYLHADTVRGRRGN